MSWRVQRRNWVERTTIGSLEITEGSDKRVELRRAGMTPMFPEMPPELEREQTVWSTQESIARDGKFIIYHLCRFALFRELLWNLTLRLSLQLGRSASQISQRG